MHFFVREVAQYVLSRCGPTPRWSSHCLARAERLVIYCQTTGVSAAHATQCATYRTCYVLCHISPGHTHGIEAAQDHPTNLLKWRWGRIPTQAGPGQVLGPYGRTYEPTRHVRYIHQQASSVLRSVARHIFLHEGDDISFYTKAEFRLLIL